VAHVDGESQSQSRTIERERAKGSRESGETARESSDRLTVTEVGGARVHNGGSGGARLHGSGSLALCGHKRVSNWVWVSGSLWSQTNE
jgi:hypothetical protein